EFVLQPTIALGSAHNRLRIETDSSVGLSCKMRAARSSGADGFHANDKECAEVAHGNTLDPGGAHDFRDERRWLTERFENEVSTGYTHCRQLSRWLPASPPPRNSRGALSPA